MQGWGNSHREPESPGTDFSTQMEISFRGRLGIRGTEGSPGVDQRDFQGSSDSGGSAEGQVCLRALIQSFIYSLCIPRAPIPYQAVLRAGKKTDKILALPVPLFYW